MREALATGIVDVDLFERARANMVASQLRPNKVTDPRILAAMASLPRERFLPEGQEPSSALAYADEDVPLGGGRVMMQPMVLARLIQLARPLPGERALVVGAGTGYGAVVLAACGPAVTALEAEERLLSIARRACAEFAPESGRGIALAEGPLAQGFAAGAPWDIILIEGGVAAIPPALAAQIEPGSGRLVTVRVGAEGRGVAILAEATPAGLAIRPAFDCAAAVLPEFRQPQEFVF